MREAIERAALNNARRRQELDNFVARSQGSQTSRIGANLGSIFKRRRLDEEMRQLQPQLDRLNQQRRTSLAEAIGGVNPENFDVEDLQKLRFAQINPRTEEVPSAIKEFNFFKKLNPNERQEYLNIKRSDPLRAKGLIENAEGGVEPIQGVEQGLSKVEEAKATGKRTGDLLARLAIEPKLINLIETGKQQAIANNVAEIERQKLLGSGQVSPQDKKKSAQAKVTNNLAEMASLYNKLDAVGAIVNIENSSVNNLIAAAESSTVGQFIGRALGTDAQSFRNQIRSIRPLLINDIRQATDMGAKGMDSEKELTFYLEAATDTNRDVQSNLAALSVLDTVFGLNQGFDKIAQSNKIKSLKSEFSQNEGALEALPERARQIGTSGGKPQGVDFIFDPISGEFQ